jgi:hypothetical protein
MGDSNRYRDPTVLEWRAMDEMEKNFLRKRLWPISYTRIWNLPEGTKKKKITQSTWCPRRIWTKHQAYAHLNSYLSTNLHGVIICLTLRVNILGQYLWSSSQSSWLQNWDVLCFLWGTDWIYICYVEESRPPLWSSGQSSWIQNGAVLYLLWGTNWIYICYVEDSSLWSSGQSSLLQNRDVLCFLWGKNWIYICYVEESRPPLWSSGQSS